MTILRTWPFTALDSPRSLARSQAPDAAVAFSKILSSAAP